VESAGFDLFLLPPEHKHELQIVKRLREPSGESEEVEVRWGLAISALTSSSPQRIVKPERRLMATAWSAHGVIVVPRPVLHGRSLAPG